MLGQAVAKALGDKKGITRYASVDLPMDETLTRVAVDVSGRPYLVWNVVFTRAKLGEMDTELFREWFQAFAQNAGITLHVKRFYGDNNHHIAESCFKGLARALRAAIEIDPRRANRHPVDQGHALTDARRGLHEAGGQHDQAEHGHQPQEPQTPARR